MNITPDTNIRLLKCPLELDNKNQITFATAAAQEAYFKSLPYLEVEASMYQRKDSSIYYPAIFDDLVEYNYVMYQNENYSNKWYYAFILGMEYVSDNCTRIQIATDPFQTWQFDLTYKSSYVEREMIDINADIPGANLVPEGLEGGEYKVGATASVSDLNCYAVWAFSNNKIKLYAPSTTLTEYTLDYITAFTVNGIQTQVHFIAVDFSQTLLYQNMCKSLAQENQSEFVVAHFTIPKIACKGNLTDIVYPSGSATSGYYVITGNATASTKSLTATPSSLDGYTPKNNKVRQYPYMYVGFNPPQGTSKIYRYENFLNGTPSFKIISEVNPNPSVYFIPQNYRGKSGDSLSDCASLNGYPQLASKIDVYNSWLAENSGVLSVEASQQYFNAQLGFVDNTVGTVGGLISGLTDAVQGKGAAGLTSMISSATSLKKGAGNYDSYVALLEAQKERQSLLPDNVTLGGSNATLLGYGLMDDNIFTRYTIKYQFAKRIDDYFSMYGYQTNELKVPNTNNRPYWNYVKTAGINILADIPQEDLQEIKDMYNNGITLWHDTTKFLDYTQNNKYVPTP